MTPETKFIVFVVTWAVLALVGYFLYRGKTADFKRRIHPRWIGFVGFMFTLFIVWIVPSWLTLAIIVPAVFLMYFLQLKLIKFCDSCGKTLTNSNWFTPMQFCQKCGANLNKCAVT